jgi:hypothetical protein
MLKEGLIGKNRSVLDSSILLAVFYFAVFAAYTFPFIGFFTDHIIGQNDALQFAWNSFNFEQSLLAGNFFYTRLMFHPWGASTVMHAGGFLSNIIALPFANKIAVVNLAVILHFVFSAIGAYRLARYVGIFPVFALVAGFVFAFSPYKMARLAEHHNLIMTAFAPFFILYYLRAFNFLQFKIMPAIVSYRYFWLAMLMGFLLALSDLVVMFHLLYFAVFAHIFAYLRKIYINIGFLKLAVVVLLALVFLNLVTGMLIRMELSDSGGLWWGGYWKDFIRPDSSLLYTFFFGDSLITLLTRYNIGLEAQVFIGYSLLAASFFALWYWRRAKPNIHISMILFVFFCIILVSIPEPFGYRRFYSPFAFLHFVPVLTELRCPQRIFSLGYLCLAIFTFFNLQLFVSRNFPQLLNIVAAVLFIVLLAEYWPAKYQLTSASNVPYTVTALKEEPAKAVLAYPLGIRDGYIGYGTYNMMHAVYQMHHLKNQLGGYISRIDGNLPLQYMRNSFTRDLLLVQQNADTLIPAKDYSAAIDSLSFEAAMVLERDYNSRGAIYLDSVLTLNGYLPSYYADGYLLLRY